MRKLIALLVALIFVTITPMEAQALKPCTSSQLNAIHSAQRAVEDAQRQVTYQQGYLRLAQLTFKSTQDSLRSEQSRVDQLTATLNTYFAQERGANRVRLLDLQVAEEKTQALLDSRLRSLKIAQSFFDNADRTLSRKQEAVSAAQENLASKQAELQRQQSKCS